MLVGEAVAVALGSRSGGSRKGVAMYAERVRSAFLEQGLAYEIHDHPYAVTAQEVAAAEGRSGWEVAKPVFAWANGELVMLVLPATLEVDLERTAAALGSERTRLATEPEFADRFPDCDTGAEPPFGNLYDVPVYADERLLEQPRITFSMGSHDQVATVRVEDFLAVARPIRVDIGAPVPA